MQLALKALESKSIALLGPASCDKAAESGKADAEYLKAFLNALMSKAP